MRHFITKKEFNSRLEMAKANGMKYDFTLQGNSRILELENGMKFYTYSLTKTNKGKEDKKEDRLPINEIYFIGVVKKYIEANGLHKSIKKNYRNKDDIKFVSYNQNIGCGEFFKDCYCIDISSAYWRSALNQGYINKDLYAKGNAVDKRVRLACLGTFAKTISVIRFDGTDEEFLPDVKPKYEHVFFNCANLIYKCMNACRKAVKEEFLFYWTDCVYVSSKRAMEVCAGVMKEHGFDNHSDYCEKIVFKENGISVDKYNDKKGKVENKFYGIKVD